jgi:NADH dehydrogenase [ubiquinone] 1 alpha subcomplex assembly factor 5
MRSGSKPMTDCIDRHALPLCKNMRQNTPLLRHVSTVLEERLSFIRKEFQETYRDAEASETYTLEPSSLDLFYSVLTLHWQQDLQGLFSKIKQSLKPQGLFIGALFGAHTLQELKSVSLYIEEKMSGHVTPRFLPLPSGREIAGLLQQEKFVSPVVDREIIVQEYDSIKDFYQDLRQMGERNCLKDRFKGLTTPRFMDQCARLYEQKFSNERGKIFATFEILYFIAWQDNVKIE